MYRNAIRGKSGAAFRLAGALVLIGLGVAVSASGRAQDTHGTQSAQAAAPEPPPPDPSLAVITGRVIDDKGAPVAGAGVRAMKVRAMAGRQFLDTDATQATKSATTDAEGVYRMSVPAGRYAVALPATPTQSTLFYPASKNASGAMLLSLDSGGIQAGVDFTLTPSHAVKVSGALSGAQIGSGLTVRLERDEFGEVRSDLDVLRSTTDADGRFTFPFVHPGRYRVRVTRMAGSRPSKVRIDPGGIRLIAPPGPALVVDGPSPSSDDTALWADASLEIPDDAIGIDNLDVWLQPGAQVRGRVVFQGTAIRPAGVPLTSTSIVLVPVDNLDQPALVGRIEADDTISLPAAPPGRYAVALLPALATTGGGWTVASISAGGRDVLGLVFDLTSDVPDLTVTMTNAPAAAITGAVHLLRGENSSAITIYAFPSDRAIWTAAFDPSHQVWFRTAKPDPQGAFALFVRPGSYLVVAVAGRSEPGWTDPDALADLAGTASLVRVDANPGRPLDLMVHGR